MSEKLGLIESNEAIPKILKKRKQRDADNFLLEESSSSDPKMNKEASLINICGYNSKNKKSMSNPIDLKSA